MNLFFQQFTSLVSIQNFPGSMPVTFGRRHFQTVINNDYMISEKTDGVRYMFLICVEGSFIINRSYNFYKVCCFPISFFLSFYLFFFLLFDSHCLESLHCKVAFDPLKVLFAKDDRSTLLDGELSMNIIVYSLLSFFFVVVVQLFIF